LKGKNGSEFNYRYKRQLQNDKGRKKKWNKLNGTKLLPGENCRNHRKYVTKGKEIAIDGKLTHKL
jgi:hypothetical protein